MEMVDVITILAGRLNMGYILKNRTMSGQWRLINGLRQTFESLNELVESQEKVK